MERLPRVMKERQAAGIATRNLLLSLIFVNMYMKRFRFVLSAVHPVTMPAEPYKIP
jgi:hypothetical protein